MAQEGGVEQVVSQAKTRPEALRSDSRGPALVNKSCTFVFSAVLSTAFLLVAIVCVACGLPIAVFLNIMMIETLMAKLNHE